MKIGVIGAGNIGSSVARNLSAAGHEVLVADAQGVDAIRDKVKEAGATAVGLDQVVKGIDALIVSVPSIAIPELAKQLGNVSPDITVIDTSNYYPFRDGAIEELQNGKPESQWVSEQFGHPVIKAFNAALAYTQEARGKPRGTPGRIALPVAGDDARGKAIAMQLVDDAGFDPVDAGSLAESWRQQPGTPAYCTELTRDELQKALAQADKEKAPQQRETLISYFFEAGATLSHDDVIAKNRAGTAPGPA